MQQSVKYLGYRADKEGICAISSRFAKIFTSLFSPSHHIYLMTEQRCGMLAKSFVSCQAVKHTPPMAQLHYTGAGHQVPSTELIWILPGAVSRVMFLVAVDVYSKWPEVLHYHQSSRGLRYNIRCLWIKQIVTDNGFQIISEDFVYEDK